MGEEYHNIECSISAIWMTLLHMPSTTMIELPPDTTNLLSSPITPHLLPLNLLPRHRQLPPQALKLPLTQPAKPPIQLLLIRLLHPGDRPHDIRRRARDVRIRNGFGGRETHVAVLVVVDVAFQRSAQGAGGGVVGVDCAQATVPEVGGGVFVCYEEDCEAGVGVCRDYGGGGGGVVFLRVG